MKKIKIWDLISSTGLLILWVSGVCNCNWGISDSECLKVNPLMRRSSYGIFPQDSNVKKKTKHKHTDELSTIRSIILIKCQLMCHINVSILISCRLFSIDPRQIWVQILWKFMNSEGDVFIHSSPERMDNIIVDDNNTTPVHHLLHLYSSNRIGKGERYVTLLYFINTLQ